jgi:hypothetical protein
MRPTNRNSLGPTRTVCRPCGSLRLRKQHANPRPQTNFAANAPTCRSARCTPPAEGISVSSPMIVLTCWPWHEAGQPYRASIRIRVNVNLDTAAGSLHSEILYLEAVHRAMPAGRTATELTKRAHIGHKQRLNIASENLSHGILPPLPVCGLRIRLLHAPHLGYANKITS